MISIDLLTELKFNVPFDTKIVHFRDVLQQIT